MAGKSSFASDRTIVSIILGRDLTRALASWRACLIRGRGIFGRAVDGGRTVRAGFDGVVMEMEMEGVDGGGD
jgi:hypothetical protein